MLKNLLQRIAIVIESLSAEPRRAFLTIFTLSFVIRFGALCLLPQSVVFWQEEAERIGLSLATTGQYADPYPIPTGPTAHTGPFFPFLMGGIFYLIGTQVLAYYVRCFSLIVAFSTLYGLLPAVARRFQLPVSVGVLAGMISAVTVPNLSAEVWRSWEEPYAALVLAGLLVFTASLVRDESLSVPRAGLYGFCWGLGFYVSASLLSVMLGLCLVHMCKFPGALRRKLAWWTLVFMSAAVVVTPWTIRNHARMGTWMFMRSNLGLEIFISNNDGAQPTVVGNTEQGWVMRIHPNKDQDQALRLRSVGEARYYRSLLGEAWQWIGQHQRRFLWLTVQRAFYFWVPPPRLPVHNFIVGLLSVLGFWGLGLTYRQRRYYAFWMLLSVWAFFPLVYYLIQYTGRYRAPIQWTIILMASVSLCEFWLKRAKSHVFSDLYPEN